MIFVHPFPTLWAIALHLSQQILLVMIGPTVRVKNCLNFSSTQSCFSSSSNDASYLMVWMTVWLPESYTNNNIHSASIYTIDVVQICPDPYAIWNSMVIVETMEQSYFSQSHSKGCQLVKKAQWENMCMAKTHFSIGLEPHTYCNSV